MARVKRDKEELYFTGSLWFAGLVAISYLIPGIFTLNKDFIIIGLICVLGVPSLFELFKLSRTIKIVSLVLLGINIFIVFSAHLLDVGIDLIVCITTLVWALWCFFKVLKIYSSDDENIENYSGPRN